MWEIIFALSNVGQPMTDRLIQSQANIHYPTLAVCQSKSGELASTFRHYAMHGHLACARVGGEVTPPVRAF